MPIFVGTPIYFNFDLVVVDVEGCELWLCHCGVMRLVRLVRHIRLDWPSMISKLLRIRMRSYYYLKMRCSE